MLRLRWLAALDCNLGTPCNDGIGRCRLFCGITVVSSRGSQGASRYFPHARSEFWCGCRV